jgi:hypothetical protein
MVTCDHKFEDTAVMVTGATRMRACLECGLVQVMPNGRREWVDLHEYLKQRASGPLIKH